MRTCVSLSRVLLLLLLWAVPALAQNGSSITDYLRYTKGTPGKLETGVVTLRAPGGQTLDLIAAVHVADASYYKKLNERFKAYDAVLYELILPEEVAGQPLPAQMETSGALSGIQGMMASGLGLVTQLGYVDYSPKNFVHADLTQEALSRTMEARQEGLMTYFQRALAASGDPNAEVDIGVTDEELDQLDLLSVMMGQGAPKDRKILKKIMAASMSGNDGMLTAMGDSALISERNKAAIKVVDQQAAKGRRKMALFYGAAHMPDLEARLLKKGWQRSNAGWLPAWII